MVLSLKVINIHNIVSFKARTTLMGLPEGKRLEIDSVFDLNSKKPVLVVTHGGYILGKSFNQQHIQI